VELHLKIIFIVPNFPPETSLVRINGTAQQCSAHHCANDPNGLQCHQVCYHNNSQDGKVSRGREYNRGNPLLTTTTEQTLGTHDIAIPLPQPRQQDQKEFFRIMLLSSVDVHPTANVMGRIERLYHQTGGRHVGIVFLMDHSISREEGVRALMSLQTGQVYFLGITPIIALLIRLD
jgi:hypothetical protein